MDLHDAHASMPDAPPVQSYPNPVVQAIDLRLYYGRSEALHGITMDFPARQVIALIGPSGCGKSTLLRCLNRMNDLIDGVRVVGRLLLDGEEINDPAVDVVELRRRVGMVFQKSNPFPKSIYENVVYGLRIAGVRHRQVLDETAEKSLVSAGLWDEVKDRLHHSALSLSGGQMQRLCIARAIAVSPEVILMDEPCSALDPRSTARVEELIVELRQQFTLVIVTHNLQQAGRVADHTAFLYEGHLVEYGPTNRLFTRPASRQTEDYLSGRFG